MTEKIGGPQHVFQRSKTSPLQFPSAPLETDASTRNATPGTGIFVSVILSTIAELRADSERSNRHSDTTSRARLGLAYLLVDNAKDEASQVLIREAAARLCVRRNQRSGIAHFAIDLAFAEDEISPSLRTLYVQAILGAQLQGLTPEHFEAYVHTGPTGRGGLSELAAVFKNSVNGLQGKPTISRRASKTSNCGIVHLPDGLLNEIQAHFGGGPLKSGTEFLIVVMATDRGAFEGTKFLGRYAAAVNGNVAQPLQGGDL